MGANLNTIRLTGREMATVLAALRLQAVLMGEAPLLAWQNVEEMHIADDGTFIPLTVDEIDSLTERFGGA